MRKGRAARGGTALEPDIVREITEPRVVRRPLSGGRDGGTEEGWRTVGGLEEGRRVGKVPLPGHNISASYEINRSLICTNH